MASSTKKMVALFVWTVTSFLCHKLAQLAVECVGDNSTSFLHVIAPLVITVCQVMTCYFTVSFANDRGRLFTLVATSHFVATLATNTSFTFIFASSTMAFKLLEPITSAVIQSLVLKTRMPPGSVLSMLVIICGSVLFVGNPLANTLVVQGTVMAFLSNVVLGIRNVGIKLDQTAGKQMGLKSGGHLVTYAFSVTLLIMGVYFLERYTQLLPESSTYFIILAFSSSVFHVIYSYVSTNVVLRYMTVVSHAIANVIKRVLVVLLLHLSGRRSVSLWNWVGLVLCTCGLLLYNSRKITSSLSSEKPSASSSSSDSSDDSESGVKPTGSPSHEATSQKTSLLWRLFLLSLLPYAFCFLVPPRTITPSYAHMLRHGLVNWRDGQPLIRDKIVFQPSEKNETYVTEFVQKQLVTVPSATDALSPYLTSTQDVTSEAERVHLNLLSSLIGRKKYVILVGLASFENKGDPAITMGQLKLIEKLKLKLVYYIDEETCDDEDFKTALKHSIFLTPDDLVLFAQGGGNMIGYEGANLCRQKGMEFFPDYQMIILSQSVFMDGSKSLVDSMTALYCCKPNLTIFLRDRLSYYIGTRMFNNGTKLILAPDMAFENGPIPRFTSPFYDILWLKRLDGERPRYAELPTLPGNVSVKIADWWRGWDTAHGSTTAETANNVFLNGLVFLQRGKVVITERLHGHIMSTLLDIPHVILDNKDNKLSSYHNTWTRGLKNVRVTNDPKEALKLAQGLLSEYKGILPKIIEAGKVKQGEF